MSTFDELCRMLGYRPPFGRPPCQHISFDRRACDRPAEVECDTGSDGRRPRYVCGRCAAYQVAVLGRIVLADEVEPVWFTAEGGIVPSRRRFRK